MNTKEIMGYLEYPQPKTRTPDIHHIHVRCPVQLWKRFRKSFPEQGDVARVMIKALELYLDLYEKKQAQEEYG